MKKRSLNLSFDSSKAEANIAARLVIPCPLSTLHIATKEISRALDRFAVNDVREKTSCSADFGQKSGRAGIAVNSRYGFKRKPTVFYQALHIEGLSKRFFSLRYSEKFAN